MHPDQDARLADTLPWLREPDPVPVRAPSAAADHGRGAPVRPAPVPGPPATPRRGLRSRLSARLGDRLPRRRAIAVLGAAGVLAGGYAVTSSTSTEVAGPTQDVPLGETTDDWAARAQVTLTSVDSQLDTIARTEAAWNAVPGNTSSATTPTAVAELKERKALLEKRRAALRSQLDSYRALSGVRADLEVAERNLEAVERALRDAPTTSALSSPDEAAALTALQEQRDLRLRQRDAKKLELASLEGNVEKAAHTPLPDDGQQTTAVSDEVMGVLRGDGRDAPKPVPASGPDRPEVVGPGRDGAPGEERQTTTTSGPPDPRGPRDETAPREPARPGPVGRVVDTVGDTAEGVGDTAAGVGDAVGDTVGGVSGRGSGRGSRGGTPKQESAPAGGGQERTGSGGVVGTAGNAVGDVGDAVTGGAREQAPAPAREVPEKGATPARAVAPAEQPPVAEIVVPQQRSAPPRSTGSGSPASTPGAEMAMAIVSSVPGGEVAAPAVEAAMREQASASGSSQQRPDGSGSATDHTDYSGSTDYSGASSSDGSGESSSSSASYTSAGAGSSSSDTGGW
jgi:hypothetical protein